ncbi:TPA: hypothetical protein N0F65_008926 [Lagenidium giganteum]|uniref:Integrase catalytic domain-containing protein n=1 Tax=Lagenidium giganteum TaxID=4803 RepID=A0AAV2YS37_9STRA|nr:TPA: hypothetical protein N0F65_008926 [Lagenidium giganteum]
MYVDNKATLYTASQKPPSCIASERPSANESVTAVSTTILEYAIMQQRFHEDKTPTKQKPSQGKLPKGDAQGRPAKPDGRGGGGRRNDDGGRGGSSGAPPKRRDNDPPPRDGCQAPQLLLGYRRAEKGCIVVRVPDVPCFVWGAIDEELLLGSDVMRSLGIDVHRMIDSPVLEEAADEFPVGDPQPRAAEPMHRDAGIVKCINDMVDRAADNGLPSSHLKELRTTVMETAKTLACQPGSKCGVIACENQGWCRPVSMKTAKIHSPAKCLPSVEIIRRNRHARLSRCGSLITVPLAGTMPNLAMVTSRVQGAFGFACFDLLKGFRRLPLHPELQEVMSFIVNVYTPVRVPQGATDSALHFQAQIQSVLSELLHKHAFVWIDSACHRGATFVQALRKFLELMQAANMKLNRRHALQVPLLWSEDKTAAFHAVIRSLTASAFTCPSIDDINNAQAKHPRARDRLNGAIADEATGLVRVDGKVAARRNEAVHWDCLWLGSSFGDSCYVLVLKDSLSHFCNLFATAAPTAAAAAECLVDDMATQPCSSLIRAHTSKTKSCALCERLKIEQRFVPAYMPWLNGSVERLNKDLLQVIRALLIESPRVALPPPGGASLPQPD